MPRKLIFMGSPQFAVVALQALITAGHEILAIYCQPDKPAGRGMHLTPCPVAAFARGLNLPTYTPKSLKKPEIQAEFAAHQADFAIVAAYGLILPQAILDAPKFGCLNIHASLLPRWRGAAPIQRAILAGDTKTGITIMQMDAGLDTGAMLLGGEIPITNRTTTPELHDALAEQGAKLIVQALQNYETLTPIPQPAEGVTYAAKLSKEEGQLDFTKPASELMRQINALTPWPGSWFEFKGEVIKVHQAELVHQKGDAGTLLDKDFTIACAHDALRFTLAQRPGKKAVSGAELLRGMGD